ncbi:GTP 3',8-cyclase [Caenorhabditis elegans]|uniref:Isoform c of Molybdenum cofactor biosynthesis protein moc-5 n=1 Tax=Caenorhabditis elegans TaxID=6239 RepID=Q20624-3|nr:GTP 3',8-cyclase [Caenorhabditis elegans]SOF58879.1 GTP 3',8-cyclase [Caenorhabditis elegans]|eukprot:NP_001343868.1 GTP 3',8-cyclase [Caenorhabditis elegans]
MSCRAGKKLFQWSRVKSSTEEIVKQLTVPLREHAEPILTLTPEQKREAVRLKIQEIEHTKGQPPFFDMFMREHTYLRISLTEKCNFRCLYCMPAEGVPLKPKDKMLSNSEVLRLVKLFAAHGVDKVRLTGGEPTIRKDIVHIVEGISSTPGIKEVGITTNGLVLQRFLPQLRDAGLTKINISIDSLDREKFAKMTRRDGFDKVWKAIELARGYYPKVKLNVVVLKHQNENEVVDFVNLTKDRNLDVRFIEFMPFGGNEFKNDNFIGYREMLNLIVDKYGDGVIRLSDSPNDTTKAYKIDGFQGQFGFITSMSDHFCNTCNRLRITADGNLKVCLHGNSEVSLRDRIRCGDSDEQLSEVIQKAVNNKKARHAVFRNGRSEEPAKSSNDSYRGLTPVTSASSILVHLPSSSLYHSHLHSSRHFFISQIRCFSTTYSVSSITHLLTHVDNNGNAKQVDVSQKDTSTRTAVARGTIIVSFSTNYEIMLIWNKFFYF